MRYLSRIPFEDFVGDLCTPGSVEQAVSGCNLVIHCASMVSFWDNHRAQMYRVNVDGTKTLAQACLRQGIQKIIYTSSVNALGFPACPRSLGDEGMPFNYDPHHYPYCHSKHLAEKILLQLQDQGLKPVIINPGTMLGEQDMNQLAGAYVINIAKGRLLASLEGGSSFCYVRDVAKAHVDAIGRGKAGHRYITAGHNLSYREVFALIADHLKKRKPFITLTESRALAVASVFEFASRFTRKPPSFTCGMARFSNIFNYFSSQKSQEQLDYKISDIHFMIDKTIGWYRGVGII